MSRPTWMVALSGGWPTRSGPRAARQQGQRAVRDEDQPDHPRRRGRPGPAGGQGLRALPAPLASAPPTASTPAQAGDRDWSRALLDAVASTPLVRLQRPFGPNGPAACRAPLRLVTAEGAQRGVAAAADQGPQRAGRRR